MKTCLFVACMLFTGTCMAQLGFEEKLDFKNRTQKAAFKDLNLSDTTHFKWGYSGSVTMSQTQVRSWQSGGINNFTLNAISGAFADYRKNRQYWLTLLDASYGISKIEGIGTQKIQDYLEVNTKYGYAFNDRWSLTIFSEGISQFANGYNYKTDPDAKNRISAFLSPGFFNEGIGLVYEKQADGLYFRAAPFTARQTVVLAPGIDVTQFGLDSGKTVKYLVGASARVDYLKELVNLKRIKLNAESRLMLFTDYHDNQQMMVNWRSKVSMNLAKVFTISVLFHIVYDPKVKFPDQTTTDSNGNVVVLTEKQKIQVLQTIGFGVGYTFNSISHK